MNTKLAEGLKAIASRINKSTGLAHPNDLGATVELLGKLIDAGHVAAHVDEVTEHLTNTLKVPDDAVRQIVLVYETLALRQSDPSGPWWKADIVDQL
jgi:hypothetical protein